MGNKKAEAEKVVVAILNALGSLLDENAPLMNGHAEDAVEEMRDTLVERVGEIIGNKIADSGSVKLAKAVLDS